MADAKDRKPEPIMFSVTEKEKKLIEYTRNIEWGEIHVFIQDKEPVRVEKTTTSTKL
ncbi:MAG: DUF2292 domain-containing protein [Oscillospiraceae bacterium]|jgi:hypothetical protein|nr:DUF2292 domain-containing protein [Oscillospiraceae bacterium]